LAAVEIAAPLLNDSVRREVNDDEAATTNFLALINETARAWSRVAGAATASHLAVVCDFIRTLSCLGIAFVSGALIAIDLALERLCVRSAFVEVALVVGIVTDRATGSSACDATDDDRSGFAFTEQAADDSAENSTDDRACRFTAAVIAVVFARAGRD
jgi:hypothetical protein